MRRLALVLILPGLFTLTAKPVAAAAPSKSNLAAAQARQAQLAQVRAQLGSTITANLATQDQLTQALAENRRQSEALAGQVGDANAKLAALDAELAELDRRRAQLEARIAAERRQLDLIARALYVQPDSLVVSLAEAGSLQDLLGSVAGLQSAARRAHALQQQLDRDQAQLAADRKREAGDREKQAAVRDGLQAKVDRLRQLNDQQQGALEALQAKLASSQVELASVNAQSAATAAYIANALATQQAEAAAAAYQSVWEQVLLLNGGPAAGGGAFTNPLPGAVLTQAFGPTDLPFEPPFAGFAHFHTGIDIATVAGTPVLAASAGTVLLAGYNPGGYGNYVVVAHAGGLDTLYGHLDSIAVRQGQTVERGQPVGAEGSSGNSTGPHLHFEVRHAGQPVDPATYIALK